LSEGPIDLVIEAFGADDTVAAAYAAARARFSGLLDELVAELGLLREPLSPTSDLGGPVAIRMAAAVRPFAETCFVTPMAAVAGAVADEVLAAMRAAAPLARVYVNNGGDIALYVQDGETLTVGLVSADPALATLSGSAAIDAASGVGGIATSGRHGRSLSLGIADAVHVAAATAAAADAAATLIANAVDVCSPKVIRRPARDLDPDSDLGARPVTVEVGPLSAEEIDAALGRGEAFAGRCLEKGLILAAALTLHGTTVTVGGGPRLATA
jgi:hypothetical protein